MKPNRFDAFFLILGIAGFAVLLSHPDLWGRTAPQSTGSVTDVQVTGLATITLASAVDSTGAVTAVTSDYADTIRCVAVYSGVDVSNDTDLEGTVDGTIWHLIDTADPNTAASFLLDDTTGPWASLRANVIALGSGVDVTVTCLATMRR